MRIKVVDQFSDGDLECLTSSRTDDFLRVSRWNLLKLVGLTSDATNEEVMKALLHKEFDIHPITDRIIPSSPKLVDDHIWTFHEIHCKWCGLRYCPCGDKYEPETEPSL